MATLVVKPYGYKVYIIRYRLIRSLLFILELRKKKIISKASFISWQFNPLGNGAQIEQFLRNFGNTLL